MESERKREKDGGREEIRQPQEGEGKKAKVPSLDLPLIERN